MMMVAGSVVIYVLSMGPLIWLERHKRMPREVEFVMGVVYWPVALCYRNVEWFHALMEPYVDFWNSLP